MKVTCAICNRFMGYVTIEGQLRKGYEALSIYVECADCHTPKTHTNEDDNAIEKLMGMFGMKK